MDTEEKYEEVDRPSDGQKKRGTGKNWAVKRTYQHLLCVIIGHIVFRNLL